MLPAPAPISSDPANIGLDAERCTAPWRAWTPRSPPPTVVPQPARPRLALMGTPSLRGRVVTQDEPNFCDSGAL